MKIKALAPTEELALDSFDNFNVESEILELRVIGKVGQESVRGGAGRLVADGLSTECGPD